MNDQELPQQGQEDANKFEQLDRISKLQQELNVFRQAEQISESGNWQINLSTYEAFYSDNYYRLYGIEPGTVHPHAHTFTSFIVADDLPVVVNALERSLVDKIPLHLEYRILRKDGTLRHVSVISTISKNNRGEMLLTAITHDITEKKNLELELSASVERIRLLNELSSHAEQIGHIGLWQLNLHTRQAFFSEGFLKVWGIKNSTLARFDDLASTIHPEDLLLFEAIRTKIFEEANALDVEFRIIRSNDGKTKIIKLKSKLIKNDEGNILHMGFIQDVSVTREMQCRLHSLNEQLMLQNQSFAQAERSSRMGSWTYIPAENKVSYSSNLFNIFGLKPEAAERPLHFLNNIHPDDREMLKALNEKMKTEEEEHDVRFRIIRADGKLRYLRSRSRTITTTEKGKVVIGSTQDITEEVQLQQQLKERINFAEMLSDTMADMIIVTDRNHHIINCNKSCAQRYKNEKQDVLNRHFFDVASEWKKTIVPDNLNKALSGEPAHSMQVRAEGGNYFEILHVPLKNEMQEVIGVLNVFHDITHAIQLKQEVQRRLEFIEKLMESSVDRIAATDANLKFILWNRKCEGYYGLPKEEVVGKHMLEVFPDFMRNPAYQGFKRALHGETVHIPAIADHAVKDYYESYLSPIVNEAGAVSGILWVAHDLRKELELQLQQKKESDLRTALQSMLNEAEKLAHLGSWELLLPEGKMQWSDEVFRLYGYEPNAFDPSLHFYYSTTHKEDRKNLKQAIDDCSEKEKTTELMCRIHAVHGAVRFVRTKIQSVLQEDQQSMRLIGTMLDITEHKALEEDYLKQNQSMQLQHQLLLQNERIKRSGTWQLNGNNKKMVWGESLFRLFGIPPHSVQPTIEDFINLIHPDDQEYVRKIFDTMIASPEVTVPEFEFRILNKGAEQTMRFNARHVFGEQVSAFFGTIMDVTLESQLKQQLQQVNTIMNLLMDTSGNRICVIDQQRRVIAWNSSWVQYTGRTEKEVTGHDFISILPEVEQDAELSNAINKGLQGIPSDISRHEAHWEIIPVITNEHITGVMIRFRDLPVQQDGQYSSSINILQ